MTEDQIKAIAEEVAHLRAFDGGYFPHEKEIREDYEVLLRFLNDRYCIVEREKVMKALKAWDYLLDYHPKISERRTAKTVANTIKDLFGASMFIQNEE